MKSVLRHIIRVFYANENFGKYGIPGMNYFMSLLAVTMYVMITMFMIIVILMAIFPSFYNFYLNTSPIFSSLIMGSIIFLLLKITFKQEIVKSNNYTKANIDKAVNLLLLYGLVVVLIIGLIALKFLRHYKK
jgi:hypothetical protein